jgi:hypothetical protein
MEKNQYQRSFNETLKEQAGFALVASVFIFPLILTVITFLYLGTTHIEIMSTLNQTCRHEALNTQAKASPIIQTIMALNSVVDIVKLARFITVLSGPLLIAFPQFMVMANSILKLTKSAERAISMMQKTLLLALRTTMELGLFKAISTLNQTQRKYSINSTLLSRISDKIVFGNFLRTLAVEPETKKSGLTKYRLKNHFEDKQKLSLTWHYRLQTSHFLEKWAEWSQLNHGRCAATLTKEHPWVPNLIVAKSF